SPPKRQRRPSASYKPTSTASATTTTTNAPTDPRAGPSPHRCGHKPPKAAPPTTPSPGHHGAQPTRSPAAPSAAAPPSPSRSPPPTTANTPPPSSPAPAPTSSSTADPSEPSPSTPPGSANRAMADQADPPTNPAPNVPHVPRHVSGMPRDNTVAHARNEPRREQEQGHEARREGGQDPLSVGVGSVTPWRSTSCTSPSAPGSP